MTGSNVTIVARDLSPYLRKVLTETALATVTPRRSSPRIE